jgi:hypothetical protein
MIRLKLKVPKSAQNDRKYLMAQGLDLKSYKQKSYGRCFFLDTGAGFGGRS